MNKLSKNILITGGAGYIGSHITEQLIINNKKVIIIDNLVTGYKRLIHKKAKFVKADIKNKSQITKIIKNNNINSVIHLAAYVGGLFKNMKYKVDMLEKNISINTNILKACHNLNIDKVISCLSTCIFPDNTIYPIDEKMLHNGPPHYSNNSYAYSKRILETHSKAYQEQYGRKYICVIPTNIYGEHDNYSLDDGHVIPSLIHRCYLAKKENEVFNIKGSGKPLRQFIYSKDLAKMIMWVVEEYKELDPIILSNSEKDEVSINYVARCIAENFEMIDRIQFDISYSDGQNKKTVDNKRFLNYHGEFNFTSIKDGIRNSIEWFKDNYENCRK